MAAGRERNYAARWGGGGEGRRGRGVGIDDANDLAVTCALERMRAPDRTHAREPNQAHANARECACALLNAHQRARAHALFA